MEEEGSTLWRRVHYVPRFEVKELSFMFDGAYFGGINILVFLDVLNDRVVSP